MQEPPEPTPFLSIPPSEWVASNDLAFAIRDRYPVSPGHTLVIPRRQVENWFDASVTEQHAILTLVDEVRRGLDAGNPKPHGYNIGVNVGTAAGQTVMHLHDHVIPRYLGDVPVPTGGVRPVIPGKGNYLRPRREPLCDGEGPRALYHAVAPLLGRSRRVDILAAFVQESGLEQIEDGVGARSPAAPWSGSSPATTSTSPRSRRCAGCWTGPTP